MNPSDRSDFLTKECGGDDSLREDVESLVAGAGKSGFLAGDALQHAARDLAEDQKPMKDGERFGSYTILSLLGKGGMGEVYRARDAVLGREVAVKVLPASFALDPDRAARFEREARLLAALNHPNIATIHGLEDHDGQKLLVLELVGGESLAGRIRRGPIPVGQTLKLALQIAEALEAAHEKGVIHRDLKPQNIQITPEGRVKVLDFGLAKAFGDEGRETGLSQSPTMSLEATQRGMLLGTAAYMSPEQARGEDVDRRADIWSFGCVLYEMLTGQSAFGAATVTESLARVLEGAADLDRLPSDTPMLVRRLIRRCLEKNPRERLQHIGDARMDLSDELVTPSLPQAAREKPAATPSRRTFVTVTGAAAAAALAGSWVTSRWLADTPIPMRRLAIGPVPMNPLYVPSGDRPLAISRDGERVAYVSASQIWLRSMDDTVPVPVGAGTHPFFSPDGEWIAYFGLGGVFRVSVSGGSSVLMFDLETGTGPGGRPAGATWSEDGTVVLATGSGLYQGSADDSRRTLELLADPPEGEIYAWPQFLPDGESVLLSVISDTPDNATIATMDLAARIVEPVHTGGVGAIFVPGSLLVYATGSQQLAAVGFDPDNRRVVGAPVDIPDVTVSVAGTYHAAAFAVSDSGTLVYLAPPTDAGVRSQFVWVDDQGNTEAIAGPPPGAYPRVSPDGNRLAVNAFQAGGVLRRIWVFDLERQTSIQVSGLNAPAQSFEDLLPEWSVDGRRIYFASTRNGPMQVWSVAADGSGTEQQLLDAPDRSIWPYRPHPDGRLLVGRGPYGDAIGVVDLADPTEYEWILARSASDVHSDRSPDGNWIAYGSTESGDRSEIYVRPFPDIEASRTLVSTGGGVQPRWDPRGRNRIYYRNLDGAMMAATFETEPAFAVTRVEELFPNDGFGTIGQSGYTYDISPTDGRFVIGQVAEGAPPSERIIQVALNWVPEVMRTMP